ncbi:hypothetical protein GSVR_27700 [Geobacter sp. SVR]|nr:hypothetical protein GSVR_27700 [Geobacter sp. SVR]
MLVIASSSPQTVYAVTQNGNVFKSTNGASSWSAAVDTDDYTYSLAIDPRNSQIVYVGTSGGLLKSTNGGDSWSTSLSGLTNIYSIAIDPTAPDIIYAGTDGGLFKSYDGGTSWSITSAATVISSIAIDPFNPQTIYLGVSGYTGNAGVYKSTNGGVSWSTINIGLTDLQVNCLAIDPANPQTIYAGTFGGAFKSTNGGSSWSALKSGLPVTDVSSIAIDPANSQAIYAGTSAAGAFKSVDGGGSWSFVNAGLTTPSIYSVVLDPGNSQNIYAGSYDGVFRSADRGEHWEAANIGLTDIDFTSLAIDPVNSTTMFLGTEYHGVFKSVDGGNSWSPAHAGLRINDVFWALAINPNYPLALYVGTEVGVFKSTNGGGSWGAVPVGGTVSSLLITPTIPETVYVGIFDAPSPVTSGIYRSTDGGASWLPVNDGLLYRGSPDYQVYDIAYALAADPNNVQTIYAGTANDGVFKSTNGGNSWSAANNGLTGNALHVYSLAINRANSQIIYAGTSSGVSKSTDGGSSWTEILGNLMINSLAIDPSHPLTVYAGTRNGVFKTTDGGSTWNSTEGSIDFVDSITIAPTDPTAVYALTSRALFKEIQGPPLTRATIWPVTVTPTVTATSDGEPVEVGVKFRSDVSGAINGLRFYKGYANTGTHIAKLWSRDGALLASATFRAETASGWQEVSFPFPVIIAANTTYVASCYSASGYYAVDRPYFSHSFDNPPLHALEDGLDGSNGVYKYGGGFPIYSYNASNYWVDVVFTPAAATKDTTAPVVTAFTIPSASSTLIVPISSFTATDNVAVTGYLVTESTTAPSATASGWTTTAPASYVCATAGTKTLYAWARGAAGNVSASRSADVTITTIDSTAPTVTDFTIPATSNSLTVPINSFTATDNVAVTGYLITESAAAPPATAGGWTATVPASYTFARASIKTLYTLAKDAAGNISTAPISSITATDNGAVTDNLVTESATAPSATAGRWTAAVPADSKTLYAWAKDATGNVSGNRSANVTMTLDSSLLLNRSSLSDDTHVSTGKVNPGTLVASPAFSTSSGNQLILALVDGSSPSNTTPAASVTMVNGVGPILTVLPGSLSFGTQMVNMTSTAQTVTLSNTGTADLTITGIGTDGSNASDFILSNTCGTSLVAGANCTINVSFRPSVTGDRDAYLTINTNYPAVPSVSVGVTGIGDSPVPTFALTASPSSISVKQGGTVTSTITAPVSGDFNSAVALTVMGLPTGVTGAFSPSTIDAPGSGTSTVTFTAGLNAVPGIYAISSPARVEDQ